MYGLNIDPRNTHGDPIPTELAALGVEIVRFTFKDSTAGSRPDRDVVRFYQRQLEELAEAGIDSLVILTGESYPDKPLSSASDKEWAAYIARFAERAAEIAKVLAPWRPVFQIWDTPDLASPRPGYDPTLREATFARILGESYEAIKRVDSSLKVITAGLVSGQPDWLARVIESLGKALPADAVAIHPYNQRPEPEWPDPEWGTGYVGDLIGGYQQLVNLPLWITEIGLATLDNEEQAAFLRRFYQTISTLFAQSVEHVFWFCYADGMVHPFGLVDDRNRPKFAYQAYQEITQPRTTELSIASKVAVPLDR
jgi:hypothetical protein